MLPVCLKGNVALKKIKILSYGVNTLNDGFTINSGIHAEHDAIRKLLPLKRKKRLENINILVIRISTKNKLQSSKPCANCITIMKNLPEKMGYKIQNVYYSDSNENIIKTTLMKLDNDEKHYSRYYRNRSKEYL